MKFQSCTLVFLLSIHLLCLDQTKQTMLTTNYGGAAATQAIDPGSVAAMEGVSLRNKETATNIEICRIGFGFLFDESPETVREVLLNYAGTTQYSPVLASRANRDLAVVLFAAARHVMRHRTGEYNDRFYLHGNVAITAMHVANFCDLSQLDAEVQLNELVDAGVLTRYTVSSVEINGERSFTFRDEDAIFPPKGELCFPKEAKPAR